MDAHVNKLGRVLGLLCVSLVSFAACSDNYLYTPTFQETRKMQVLKKRFEYTNTTASLDDAEVLHMARHYEGHGEGPIEILVTYNSKVSGNSAIRATDEAARVADVFRRNGVTNLQANVLPVKEEHSKTIVSYIGYVAQKPEGCVNLLDRKDHDAETMPKYRYGCTVMDLVAKQMVRPDDLLGKDRTAPNQAARDAIAVEQYRSFTPVEIEGVSTGDIE